MRMRRAVRKIRATMLEHGFDLEPYSDETIIDAASENIAELTIKAEPAVNARHAMTLYFRSVAAQTECYSSIDYLSRVLRRERQR